MNKRQRKKHGVAKLPGRRREFAPGWASRIVEVTESCGNVFRDLGLLDADRLLEDAERASARTRSRRVDRIRNPGESQG